MKCRGSLAKTIGSAARRGPSLGDQQARLARNLPDPSGEHNEPLGHPPEG